MQKFSKSWKASKKPKKQRKYSFNAPSHIRKRFLGAHLSDDLIKKYGGKTAAVKKGDRVKVMKGQFKDKTGKVEGVDTKKIRAYIEGVGFQKKDGTRTRYPVSISNLMIVELDMGDKRRQERLKRK